MDGVPTWVILVFIGALGTLIGIIWKGTDKRLDSHASRLNEHDRRITKIEEQVHTHEIETGLLRQRWHDLKDEVTSTLAGWFVEVMKNVDKLRDEFRRNGKGDDR